MNRSLLLISLPALVAFTTPTVVTWSARPVVASRGSSGQATIRVHGSIINKWHLYSMSQKPGGPKALSFELEPNSGFSLGRPAGPKPEHRFDAEFKMNTDIYSGSPDFTIPIRWTKPLAGGTTELKLIIRYMACSDKSCLPPRKEAITVQIKTPAA